VLKLKDIIALGLLAVVTFPIVLLGVLLWTGNVRMVFGPETQDPNARAKLLVRPEDIPGATVTASTSSSTITVKGASTPESSGNLDQREAEVLRETKRLEDLRLDDGYMRDTIRAERVRLEKLLSARDSLESKRTEVLAATFVGMKPDQAAKILVALDDILVTAVIRRVSDDKSRAKILAALGKLDVQRAARVTRLLESGRGLAAAPAETASTPKVEEPKAQEPKAEAPKAAPSENAAPAKPEAKKTAAPADPAKP
jgi:flagellar motility protein MotE (MotC chaperone)